jgi:large subunit ribosomal protein L9
VKVILIKDVEKVGEEGEVVNVSDGYGRNYLMPRGLVAEATPAALAQNEKRLAKKGQPWPRPRKPLFCWPKSWLAWK